jgi:hypothetical protein
VFQVSKVARQPGRYATCPGCLACDVGGFGDENSATGAESIPAGPKRSYAKKRPLTEEAGAVKSRPDCMPEGILQRRQSWREVPKVRVGGRHEKAAAGSESAAALYARSGHITLAMCSLSRMWRRAWCRDR